ncbi:DUF6355 family natural product biosynthesis protein [Amycolatopsis magusensis]|uniref:DUF6355 family natural product biosynthesis protein n=1 Tax=Amycolatopsis magusensis TaxID=882444 RepID=UPI0024A92C68|nr:DUF6355 family natural product biosynthesis protein [Amycolatopsis magusensis]MDI5979904.1 DUF6355 family natural product biosynthesis protein [Amycolatopsis magusensis]
MSPRNLRRLGAALLLAAAASAAGTFTPVAADTPREGTVQPMLNCGYDTDVLGINAYYTHCDPNTHVVINIHGKPWVENERCVGPGETRLGFTSWYIHAWYSGRSC